MLIGIGFILFIFGSFIGSFLNVLIDRIPRDENFISGRSHCEYCHKELSALDLIPIISFTFLQGKCRYCHHRLSYLYPFMEILTGVSFVIVYFYSWTNFIGSLFIPNLAYLLAIVSLLSVIFFIDLKDRIIPDIILISLLIVSFVFQLLIVPQDLLNHLISALISFLFFFLIFAFTRGRGMGFGDVKLAFLVGFLLGFPSFVLALYTAFLTGSITSIILILWGKKKLKKDTIAFGPFLVIGILTALFASKFLIPIVLPFLLF